MKGVSIITCTMRDHLMNEVFDNYQRQRWNGHMELIIVLNNDEMDIRKWKKKALQYQNVKVYQVPQSVTVGECKNFAVDQATYDVIAKLDDDDYYSPFFIDSSMKVMKKTNAAIVGKKECFYYLEGSKELLSTGSRKINQYVPHVADSSMLIQKKVFKSVQFPHLPNRSDTEFQKAALEAGFRIYAGDQYDYLIIRKANTSSHTWRIKDEELRTMFKKVSYKGDVSAYVIDPEKRTHQRMKENKYRRIQEIKLRNRMKRKIV